MSDEPIENTKAFGVKRSAYTGGGTSGSKGSGAEKQRPADVSIDKSGDKSKPEMGKSFSSNVLAPVQRQTLEFLRNFIAERGYAPTLKDIAEHIGVKSVSTAHFHLERLEQKGFIKRGSDGSLELVNLETPQLGASAVPLVGVIAAGAPIEAIENKTWIDVPPSMIDGRGEVYCLEVSGDSMIDAHICDGDMVVIKKQDSANDGQIVVAMLDDGTVTLKTFRRLKTGQIMLIPANARLQPMTVDKVTVQGRLIGVIRELH